MLRLRCLVLGLLKMSATALPTSGLQYQLINAETWSAGAVDEYPIHRSCNLTETVLLREAFLETETLAAHAKDHIMRFGNASSFYTKYFGSANTGEPAGWFNKIVDGDKAGVLFRCDDIDGNCHQEGWAGHWRGSNASDETVICELSFTSRKPLTGLCGYGYTVAAFPTTTFFGSDLLHRLYHTDKIGEGVVGHYADTYEDCLQLAKDSPEQAVRNSATLRYFALDVYGFDIANPGLGCTGQPRVDEDDENSHNHGVSSSASATSSETASRVSITAPASTSSENATSTTTAPSSLSSGSASRTSTAALECHTHDGGVVHCVS